MRNINVAIYHVANSDDNVYTFNSLDTYNPDSVYQLNEAILNYSIQSSAVTSTLVLSMNQPLNPTNVLRSGQPVQITDEGVIVFEGFILSAQYVSLPLRPEGDSGGTYLIATLAPSIYQLTITPMIFDSKQAQQIAQLTGVDINAILVGVTQDVETNTLLNYVISNMYYSNVFLKTINSDNLSSNLFLMASPGESRDSVLRSSLDFYNTVIYQQETGEIIIRQLDATITTPFNLDVNNQFGNSISGNVFIPVVPMLNYNYTDNAFSTPAITSNYAILQANLAFISQSTELVLSYAPNPKFYPRIATLQNAGWFTGVIGNTQINQNIVSDPAVQEALQGFQVQKDQYMNSLIPRNVAKNNFISSYQALLTGKQMGQALTGYSNFSCTISLDDPNLPQISNIIGACVEIQNCDMSSGIIAAASRAYGSQGSYLNMNIAPLGSITGYWKS